MYDLGTREELEKFLTEHHVPYTTWGTGTTNSLEKMLSEITSGECQLSIVDGHVLRTLQGVGIRVYYHDTEVMWYLKEEYQLYHNGERCCRNMRSSIAEKRRLGEDPLIAVRRALAEELQITEEVPVTFLEEERLGPELSRSYPGLYSVSSSHNYRVDLPKHLFKPEGYQEIQPKKTTYFIFGTEPSIKAPDKRSLLIGPQGRFFIHTRNLVARLYVTVNTTVESVNLRPNLPRRNKFCSIKKSPF